MKFRVAINKKEQMKKEREITECQLILLMIQDFLRGANMKRTFLITTAILLTFFLMGCNSSPEPENALFEVELTEREKAILNTTAEYSFVFGFNLDENYGEASVWVEKYEYGDLVDDGISQMTSEVDGSGSIIFAVSPVDDNQSMFNFGVTSNGTTASIQNTEMISDNGENNMATLMAPHPEENIPVSDDMVLAGIYYSSDDGSMAPPSSDFYTDMEQHIDELADFEMAYLIRSRFAE